MPVTRLGHINIRTPDYEKTLAFYEAALGLTRGPARTMADQKRNAWLYDPSGAPVVHINSPKEGEAARPADIAGRLDHVAFDCTNPDDFATRLEAAGIAFEMVHTAAGGFVQYNLRDPNGIKVELTFAP